MSKAWWSKGYYSGYWNNNDDDDRSSIRERTTESWYKEDTEFSWREAYRSRYKSSLGYSSGKLFETTTNSYYSYKYSYNPDEDEKNKLLLEKAYKSARDLVIILDFPFKISIQLSSSGDELDYGYERRLFIPTDVLDRKEYVESEKINICCGQAIHEAAHLKFTTYEVLNNFLTRLKIDKKFLDENLKDARYTQFLSSLINIVEDVRIESELLESRPGYLEFIELYKTYQYKKFIETSISKSGKFISFMNNLFRLIRYPEEIEDNVLEEYSETYKTIQSLLSPMPESTKDSCLVAYKIYKEILSVFKDLKLKDLESINSSLEHGHDTVLYGLDKDGENNPNDSRIFSAISNDENCSGVLTKLVVGSAEKADNKTYFERMRGNQKEYEDFVQQINPYVPAIRKILKDTDKNYEFNISSQRFGLLDTSKLAEAYQGVNTVYLRKGQVKTNKTTLVILIDASGSMYGSKMLMAKKAGILLNEAFKGLSGVDLYIYSHTADMVEIGSTEIKIFREAGKLCDPYALSNLMSLNENRDGTAILQTVKRVKKISHAEKILMFVISDGEPCAADFYGAFAIESTRKNVIKATSLGATIIQVTIDTVNRAKDMFDYCIDLKNNLGDLPKELGKVIKSAVLKDRKTTII